MDRRIALALCSLVATTSAGAALAGPDCQCRGNGTVYDQGEVACIRTNAGPKLARCDMALNNSTWTIVSDGCPSAARPLGRLFAYALFNRDMPIKQNGE